MYTKNMNCNHVKVVFVLLLILLTSTWMVNAQEVMGVVESIPEKSDFHELRSKLRNDDIDSIEQSIARNDFNAFSNFLHEKLDKNQIRKIFETFQLLLKGRSWNIVTHYNAQVISNVRFGFWGDINMVMVQQKIGDTWYDYDFNYTYCIKDSALFINSLSVESHNSNFYKTVVPFEFKKLEDISDKLNKSADTSYEYFRALENEYQVVFDSLKKYDYAFIQDKILYRDMSRSYGSLSWHLLIKKDFQGALKAAKRGLELKPAEKWINTNLALAYLLAGDYSNAEKIYNDLKNVEFTRNKPFKEVFLKDIEDLQKQGINHPDFEKVKQLLSN